MPSFDTVSEIDMSELQNGILQAKKELTSRFDFKGSVWEIEEQKDKLVLHAENDFKLKALTEILLKNLAKRGVSLKNLDLEKTELSSVGRARQEVKIRQGFETEVAKEIVAAVKSIGLKTQAQITDRKVRVSGKSRDDLQAVMQKLRTVEIPAAISFNNFRD